MNLSCSGGGLPESGCLFFKVFGMSNVTNGKSIINFVPQSYNETLFHSKIQLYCTRNT